MSWRCAWVALALLLAAASSVQGDPRMYEAPSGDVDLFSLAEEPSSSSSSSSHGLKPTVAPTTVTPTFSEAAKLHHAFNLHGNKPQLGSAISVHKIHTNEKDGAMVVTFDFHGNGSSTVKGTKEQDPRCADQILQETNSSAVYKWCPAVGRCTKSHCPEGNYESKWKCVLEIGMQCTHLPRRYAKTALRVAARHGQTGDYTGTVYQAHDVAHCQKICENHHSMGCEFKPRHFACMAEYKKGNECTIQKIQSDQPRLQNRRYAGECWEAAVYADGTVKKIE